MVYRTLSTIATVDRPLRHWAICPITGKATPLNRSPRLPFTGSIRSHRGASASTQQMLNTKRSGLEKCSGARSMDFGSDAARQWLGGRHRCWASLQSMPTASLLHPGIEGVAQAVAEEVEGEHRQGEGDDRPDQHVRVGAHRLDTLRDHQAPAGGRRFDTEAEEGEPRLIEDRAGDAERGGDDDRGQAVRE